MFDTRKPGSSAVVGGTRLEIMPEIVRDLRMV